MTTEPTASREVSESECGDTVARTLQSFLGALIGGAIPAIAGTAIYWLNRPDERLEPLAGLTWFFYLGAAAGFICGGLFGPSAVATDRPWRLAGIVAAVAVPVAVLLLFLGAFLLGLLAAVSGSAGWTP